MNYLLMFMILNIDYFQTTMMLYDTKIIKENTFNDLYDLTLEYPISRLLCDSRILNIFEGAAEMQADVIARRLLTSN